MQYGAVGGRPRGKVGAESSRLKDAMGSKGRVTNTCAWGWLAGNVALKELVVAY